MDEQTSPHLNLARRTADRFCTLPNVEALAVAGSLAMGNIDPDSDIDLYVYITAEVPLHDRMALVETLGASRSDLDLNFWDPGDAWVDADTGIELDVMYWHTIWIEDQLDRILTHHQASVGYSTCFWHTVQNSQVLYDRRGWLGDLKRKVDVPYPEILRRAIVAKNHPILRRVIPSYRHQIESAIRRDDGVSINHRVAAFFASYFDVLFGLNRLPHPGEKRILEKAASQCPKVPRHMVSQVEAILSAASASNRHLLTKMDTIIDEMDRLLILEGFDPTTSAPAAH